MKVYKRHLFLFSLITLFFIGVFSFTHSKSTFAATLVNEYGEELSADYSGVAYNSYDYNELYLLDNGKIVTSKEIYDPVTDAWYWFESDGIMARSKEVFLATNEERTEGKWVYYDENGHMVKGFFSLSDENGDEKTVFYDEITGEMKHGESFIDGGWYRFDEITGAMVYGEYVNENGWYYYDENTGIMQKGFVNLIYDSSEKLVFYDEITGVMQHGEYCIDDNWYRFDNITGEVIYGEYVNEKGSYYYDEDTGIMYHGLVVRNGSISKYDKITGIFISEAGDESKNDVWTLQDLYDYIDILASLNKDTINIKKNSAGADIYCKTDNELKIMQVTDMHISGVESNYRKNILSMQTVYEMASREQPDFIVSTGDLVFGNVYSNNEDDSVALDIVLKFMDAMDIPWTWTFGNHDHDYFDRLETEELTNMLSKCSTLYMAENNPTIKGYSNAVFRVYKNDTLSTALILLDSHGEIWDSNNTHLITYDYIDESQITWYKNKIQELNSEAGKTLDTFVYIHIPIEEYALIDSANYLSGEKRETVACSSTHNMLAETMIELGSTKALFCGHDHVNDFIALYNGMYFVYSKSIDYTAYIGIEHETAQRGICILTINKDNTFNIQNVCYR